MEDRKKSVSSEAITDKQVEKLRELAGSLQFGTITLVFQNGVLIQIDKAEKIRVH